MSSTEPEHATAAPDAPNAPNPPKTPSPQQRQAIDAVRERAIASHRRGQLLLGGTGAGKTLTSIVAINEIVSSLSSGPKLVYCVVPSMGQTVFHQWRAELADQGCGDRTLIYHGPNRGAQLAAFRARFQDEAAKGAHAESNAWWVITSIDTTHADVIGRLRRAEDEAAAAAAVAAATAIKRSRRVKDFSPEQMAASRVGVVSELGRIDIVLIDECHVFGNGSPPTDSSRDLDPTKTFYLTLNELIMRNAPRFVLGLTATPTKNTCGEVWSMLRFMFGGGSDFVKSSFVQETKDRNATTRICREYVVKIPAIELPPTIHATISHGFTDREVAIHRGLYQKLYATCDMFVQAIRAWANQKGNPEKLAEKERTKRLFLMHLTRARRAIVHPCFGDPPKRADPAVAPARDAAGQLVYGSDEAGNRIVLGKPLPIDVAATVAAWPINQCSKMRAVLDRLASISNERVVVQMTYAEPCDLFEAYFRLRFPDREIYIYHGGRSRRAEAMSAFKTGAPNAVLVATRGSCEMAVNIECTTMGHDRRLAARQIFLDLPFSKAEQTQAEGRIKRPQAQGHPDDPDRVTAWYAETALAEEYAGNTIEDFFQRTIDIKEARASEFLRDVETPDAVADSTAMSGKDEIKNDSVLATLLDTLKQYRSAPGNGAKKRKLPQNRASAAQHASSHAAPVAKALRV